jgi:monoamine oxidase
VRAPIALEHRLVAIRPASSGVTLVFARRGASSLDVAVDAVVLAIPFSTLRRVEVDVPLPPAKRRAIAELAYGTNAKLLVGCATRPWRSGSVLSDEPFQLAWDASRLQPGTAGTLTVYLGGDEGVAVGAGHPRDRARELLPALERALPGVTAAAEAHGRVDRIHWPSHPHALGSYACYRPGDWTSIHGAEPEPAPPLYFAGEHCDDVHQGYIEGALRSGIVAADAIAAAVGA